MMKLAIVSPCYNEEEVLESSARRLLGVLDGMVAAGSVAADSFIIFVNDGSRDRTWEIIRRLHEADVRVKGLCLARNVGHQSAIMAGMMEAKDMADAVITIDADLQDDLRAIPKMVDEFVGGYDVVYGVKVQRAADPLLKRLSAAAFYKLQAGLGVDSVSNHADFRLMSRRALQMLAGYSERNIYLRGLIPLIGLDATTVADTISERAAGKSKYTLGKMLSLALDGITSFSVKPIYCILYVGLAFILVSIAIGIYVAHAIVAGTAVPGWSSLILSVWLVGGIVLLSVGVVGAYVGKIYNEVKRRPLYNIKESLLDDGCADQG